MSHFLDYLYDPADKDLQNEIVGEVWHLTRQLKARGLLARRLPLLASDDLTVRRETALESVADDGTYPDSFLAREALARWRGKGLIVYGV